jgi:hypothetical protein
VVASSLAGNMIDVLSRISTTIHSARAMECVEHHIEVLAEHQDRVRFACAWLSFFTTKKTLGDGLEAISLMWSPNLG